MSQYYVLSEGQNSGYDVIAIFKGPKGIDFVEILREYKANADFSNIHKEKYFEYLRKNYKLVLLDCEEWNYPDEWRRIK